MSRRRSRRQRRRRPFHADEAMGPPHAPPDVGVNPQRLQCLPGILAQVEGGLIAYGPGHDGSLAAGPGPRRPWRRWDRGEVRVMGVERRGREKVAGGGVEGDQVVAALVGAEVDAIDIDVAEVAGVFAGAAHGEVDGAFDAGGTDEAGR